MNQTSSTRKPATTAKSAFLFGSGTLTSRFLGLFRDSLLYSLIPLDLRDAWLAAWRIPNFFRRLLGEGGLSVSFIPLYVASLAEKDPEGSRQLAHGVFTLLLSLVLLICTGAFFTMEQWVPSWLSGSGFSDVPGKLELTVQLGKIMIFFLFFVTLFAYFMALLNSHKKFALSGYAPMFLNIAIIAGLWAYQGKDQIAQASAVAVVIGGALQALFLLPSVVRLGLTPRLTTQFYNPKVRRVLTRFLPTVFGVGVLQILGLVNFAFASRIQGAVSYINLGDRLLELPLSLIAVSIGTTLLPTLSSYWNTGARDTFMHSLGRHLSLFYFLAIPSAFGFWFLGVDIIDVLFQRGEFAPREVLIVADILKIYSLTLIAAGSLKILNQGLYATGDTLTPALISAAGLVIHLLLAPYLMVFMGLNGLVLSTALISLFNLVCCLLVIQKRIARLNWRPLLKNAFCCFSAAAAMGAYLTLVNQLGWKQGRFLMDFPILLVIIFGAGLVYFSLAAVFKVEELAVLTRKWRARWPKT